jgi:3-oxoacyl-[acyl-carrier protein] reductase
MTRLTNKTALVTGASRGMGRATALALAAAGARVIVHYGRKGDEAKAVVEQVRAAGGRADAVAADFAAPEGAHRLAAQVRNLIGDRLDILVSNAGISKAATIEEMNVADFDNLFASTCAHPISWYSNCCRSSATAAASFSCLRSERGRWSARFPLIPAQKAQSAR